MVTVWCAVVGVENSVFPVEMEANDCVGELKNRIKEKMEYTVKCDADQLQLYLMLWYQKVWDLEQWNQMKLYQEC